MADTYIQQQACKQQVWVMDKAGAFCYEDINKPETSGSSKMLIAGGRQ
jgi:hypothetical protein